MSRLETIALPTHDVSALPRARVWDCFNHAQTLAAAFEAHEAAMEQGFMPDEATTLSLVLAELALRACREARGAVASLFLAADGWRLELACPQGAAWRLGESALLRSLTSAQATEIPGVGTLLVAEHRRAANA